MDTEPQYVLMVDGKVMMSEDTVQPLLAAATEIAQSDGFESLSITLTQEPVVGSGEDPS